MHVTSFQQRWFINKHTVKGLPTAYLTKLMVAICLAAIVPYHSTVLHIYSTVWPFSYDRIQSTVYSLFLPYDTCESCMFGTPRLWSQTSAANPMPMGPFGRSDLFFFGFLFRVIWLFHFSPPGTIHFMFKHISISFSLYLLKFNALQYLRLLSSLACGSRRKLAASDWQSTSNSSGKDKQPRVFQWAMPWSRGRTCAPENLFFKVLQNFETARKKITKMDLHILQHLIRRTVHHPDPANKCDFMLRFSYHEEPVLPKECL